MPQQTSSPPLRPKKTFLVVGSVWVVYALLAWLAPVNETALTKYHLSALQARLLGLSLTIPIALIWLLAAYGAAGVNRYAYKIRKTQEGKGFDLLAKGIYVLLAQLILSSFVNLASSYRPSTRHTVGIINVYLSALFSLGAFGLLAVGSQHLLSFIKQGKAATSLLWIPVAIIAVIGWLYVQAILGNDYRSVSNDPSIQATFGVGDNFIFLTLVPLYLTGWFAGLVAIINLALFRRRVPGAIYQTAFRSFARGFFCIIGLSIALQLLSQAASSFSGFSIGQILGLIYVIIAIIVLGYLLVADGSKKLLKLEMV